MFVRDVMKCSDNRTLQQRPYTFGGVCVDLSANPFVDRVVDGFVQRLLRFDPAIRFPVVREDRIRVGCVFLQEGVQRCPRPISGMDCKRASPPRSTATATAFLLPL